MTAWLAPLPRLKLDGLIDVEPSPDGRTKLSAGWPSKVRLTVPLNAGTNTVRATATTANGGPNVDWLETS